MKFKKMLSLFAASAIAVSSFAGLAVTSSAAAVGGVAGTVDDLVAADATTIYHVLAEAEFAGPTSGAASYESGKLYFGNELASVGSSGNLYQTGKTSYDIDGTTKNSNGIRLKGNQDVFALKLEEGSTLKAYISGGGGGDRYGTLSTTLGSTGDLVTTETLGNYTTLPLEYTADADRVVYLSATGDSFISQIQVTVPGTDLKTTPEPTAEPTPEPTPVPAGPLTLKYTGSNSDINGGNQCDNKAEFLFTADADADVASFFADADDPTKLDAGLIAYYKNYIAGTGNDTHPSVTASLPKGSYKMYYLGFNHGNNITATFAGTGDVVTAGAGANFAYQADDASRVLKVYTFEFDVDAELTGETITFNSTDQWLPDLYAIVITNQKSAKTEPVILKYNSAAINGGNANSNSAEYTFVDGVDANVASFFADANDDEKLDASLMSGFKNYITGTDDRYGSPSVKADLPAGTYKIYFLGYNHGKEVNATIASTGETVADTSGGKNFAYQSDDTSRVLKVYTLEFTLPTDVTGDTITFDSTVDQWLPDLYAVVITNQEFEGEPAPTPEPDPEGVMPDFSYTFSNSNTTELTSTASGTYYLDKDGKLQTAASYETVTASNVAYHNDHGLSVGSGSTFSFRAQAPFQITVGTCTYGSATGQLTIKDMSGNVVYSSDTVSLTGSCYKNSTSSAVNFVYTGTEMVDVTLTTPTGGYFPYLGKKKITTDTISGSLVGAEGLNEGTLTFTSQATGQAYTATISNGTYSVVLPTKDTYSIVLKDCNYVNTTATYKANGDSTTADINCVVAAEQSVTGTIANAPAEAFTLTFTATGNAANTKTVDLAAGAASYEVALYPDTYVVTSSTGTLSPISSESFLITNAAYTKNLYYPEVIPAATASTVTVYKDQAVSGTNYHTISDAVAGIVAAKVSNPTIVLKSGETYQEQVVIDYPNVTLKTDGDAKATITWYYGIGYTYYSLNKDGMYDKDRAMTKVDRLTVSPWRWGGTVHVKSNADGFKAENIIFENSFNQRFTAEEVADGVMYNGLEAITVDRQNPTIAADSKNATERAAAIIFENDPQGCELYDCEFIGSQDTFFTSGTIYLKDCAITGNTDYIFGGGSVVFDNCDLIWGGYSDRESGGHITASSGSAAGYIFRDCTIKDGNRIPAAGTFGRDWGGKDGAHAYFINCVDETVKGVSGWANMGGAVKDGTADLHVFDLENPSAYATYGSSDKYNITPFTFEDAKAKYENVIAILGFTPSALVTADTTAEALDAGEYDEVSKDYVYGVVTTITAGDGATASKVNWVIKDADDNTYTFSTADSVDGVNMLSKGVFPTITGGEAKVTMLFHAEEGTYNVASQAE